MKAVQEPDRVEGRKIFTALVVTIAVGVVSVIVSTALLGAASRAGPTAPASAAPRTIGVVEQTPIGKTAVGLDQHAKERASLERWGAEDGGARVPIERAMDFIASQQKVR